MTAPRVDGIGASPHAGRAAEALWAYARGALGVLPEIVLGPHLGSRVIEAIAKRRLARMVRHASERCPYYRERFARVDHAAVARGDLTSVPLLEKGALRDEGMRLRSDRVDASKLVVRSSSGSSGVPTRVAFDPLRELPRRTQELRMLLAHGFRPGDRQLVFDHPGHLTDARFLPQRLGLWRRVPYPWQVPIDEGVAFVERERFEILHGVLSSLRLLALAVRRAGGLRYRPRLLLSKGELLDPATRALIESELRAPLVDYYATEEAGILAWQAPDGDGYLIDADLVHLEAIDPITGAPKPPGEVGEIVVTNLYMRAMPIVRYRTGDFGVIGPPSGRYGLPRLRELRGRRMDFVITPSGEVHHPFALLGVLEERAELERYRVRQLAIDHVRVELAYLPRVSETERAEVERAIEHGMQARLGREVRVTVAPFEDEGPAVGQKYPLVRGLGVGFEEVADKIVRL